MSSLRGSGVLFIVTTLAGCGGAPKAPAESPTAAPASSAAPQGAPAADPPTPGSEAAPAGGGAASAAPPAAASAEPAAPKKRAAPIDIAIVGKFAGDADVERVVFGARTGLQNCYENGLEAAPTAMGTVDFKIQVTASGVLKKVESANPNTMPGNITNCMVGRFGALSFEPKPARTIDVKVTCKPNE